MIIKSVDVIVVEIPFDRTYRTADGVLTGRRVLVRVETDDGIEGYGESVPIPWYDEPSEVVEACLRCYLAPALIGKDPFDVSRISDEFDRIFLRQNSAKNALITALYDIMGKALGVPVYDLIGGLCNKDFPAAVGIGFDTPDPAFAAEEVRRWFEDYGIGLFKVKIGRPGPNGTKQDLKTLDEIRCAEGDSVSLRVDANESYDGRIAVLREMETYGLELIEQPTWAGDLQTMREMTAALDTPVLADQSVHSLHDAGRVVKARAADVLMVKNYKTGGFYRSKQLLGLLKATHFANYLEGGVETGIGTAATLHLAASVSRVNHWGCLFGPLIFVDDLLAEPIQFSSGRFSVPSGPGLGVTPDMDKIRKYSVSS